MDRAARDPSVLNTYNLLSERHKSGDASVHFAHNASPDIDFILPVVNKPQCKNKLQ
jgi:hypothetical protein